MLINKSNIEREGFSVLHGKWGGISNTIIGINGKESNPTINTIGYLAYPNPTLKNNIPGKKFYIFFSISYEVSCASTPGTRRWPGS